MDQAFATVYACFQGDKYNIHTDKDDEDKIPIMIITMTDMIICSLINSCTIDWFTDWPEDALEKVAHSS